jgi:hypothetical protein
MHNNNSNNNKEISDKLMVEKTKDWWCEKIELTKKLVRKWLQILDKDLNKDWEVNDYADLTWYKRLSKWKEIKLID